MGREACAAYLLGVGCVVLAIGAVVAGIGAKHVGGDILEAECTCNGDGMVRWTGGGKGGRHYYCSVRVSATYVTPEGAEEKLSGKYLDGTPGDCDFCTSNSNGTFQCYVNTASDSVNYKKAGPVAFWVGVALLGLGLVICLPGAVLAAWGHIDCGFNGDDDAPHYEGAFGGLYGRDGSLAPPPTPGYGLGQGYEWCGYGEPFPPSAYQMQMQGLGGRAAGGYYYPDNYPTAF